LPFVDRVEHERKANGRALSWPVSLRSVFDSRRRAVAALEELALLVADMRTAADRLEEQLEAARDQLGVPQPRESRRVRQARLIALNMATNGAPREEADRYLAERLGIVDRGALLDDAYRSVP
jgi:crotonobetainyl-CoA:carnitine CoA-transferase CaiB-like acyl-CoA transferase